MNAFRNRWFGMFAVAWLGAFSLRIAAGDDPGEPLALLALFGIAFPGLALLALRGTPAPSPPGAPRPGEAAVIVAILAWIVVFLAVKGTLLGWLEPPDAGPRWHEIVNTALKLVAFVLLPLVFYAVRCRGLPDVGRSRTPAARLWIAFFAIGLPVVAVTLVISRGSAALLDGSLSPSVTVLGALGCFAWMAVEAGIVEEVSFRYLLQSRIGALIGSPVGAIWLCALLFGLAHVPGMWLRGAGAGEGLGEHPTLVTVIAYAITTQGVAGLLLAVVWQRARSLPLAIGLHALVDAASGTTEFIDTWGLR